MDPLGLPLDSLADWLDTVGVPRTHAGRVFRGLHGVRRQTAEEAADGKLRQISVGLDNVRNLGRHAATVASHTGTPVTISEVHATDNTQRLVFTLADGKRVEGVLLPNTHRPDRTTLCLSSQVGCAMACTFCATGTLGLARNLTAAEIVAQVYVARAHTDKHLSHLVFMGMGEPLQAYSAVRDALKILLDSHGQPFAADQITVSTVGLPDRMQRLYDDFGGRIQLALSLHAGTDETRQRIVPLAKRISMQQLRDAVLPHTAHLPVLVEYVLLPGVNDSEAEMDGLAEWMHDLRGVVNIIPFNPFRGASFRSPTREEVERTWRAMKSRGIRNTVRWPRGREANGACGQLMLA